jgi:hypothetical protein
VKALQRSCGENQPGDIRLSAITTRGPNEKLVDTGRANGDWLLCPEPENQA